MQFVHMLILAIVANAALVVASASEHNAIHNGPHAVARHARRSKKCATTGASKYASGHKSSKKSKSGSTGSNDASNTSNETSQKDAPVSGTKPKGLKGKAGLCWPNGNSMDFNNFKIGNVNWAYTWQPTKMGTDMGDTLFCSMLWGRAGAGAKLGEYKSKVTDNPEGGDNGDKCTMGPNEVNQSGQADMNPSDTCSLMRQYQLDLKKKHGYYLIGPSTTSAPNGKDWYDQFKKVCPDVFEALDAISLHYYDVSATKMQEYIEDWYKSYNKPVWITEYACQNFNGGAQCSKDQVWSFQQQIVSWMDKQDYVKGYAPFGAMKNLQGVSEVNRLSNGNNATPLFRMIAGM
ncbi:Uncharacterised protein family, glycosyl hydrolase catalytic domain [Ceraceosorus bombacis]|uniref:Uncharacterized protein family, glycosyl hydrolase catalytic domain n=1 Tax=Ceraceosorus bombacis TaxID=401625 RepID=A0A0N7LB16_9BASI|nr:Uncharacterised protein family, glycosyl hydrolase catalytic domain [Ceraceosorus bombacis]